MIEYGPKLMSRYHADEVLDLLLVINDMSSLFCAPQLSSGALIHATRQQLTLFNVYLSHIWHNDSLAHHHSN